MSNQTAFLETKEYRRFVEFCEACRKYQYIGVCYGEAGVGKTMAAKHLARWDLLSPWLNLPRVEDEQQVPLEILEEHTLYYTSPVVKPTQIGKDLSVLNLRLAMLHEKVHYQKSETQKRIPDFYGSTELVLIDEADRLKLVGLELIRDMYDQHPMGIVLIGMPGLERQLMRYPQLYSRIGFAHEYKTLKKEEMTFILKNKWKELGLNINLEDFTDYEAFTAVVRMTGGNFRLIQRLFTQIERVMAINQVETISKEVVDAARESLIIGHK
ncbi:AAA family ATPase [Virgibacillus salexigens]|uniref:AAA family ATPase n=1 Tax=Virgibacillus massiliensis TaxID=1462526 RepID=UPI00136F847D|nr:AAA family ATPase [Virgibacillus massiliensis]MYL43880.1 AAA family ATPase [Virgibacillus massiliensis]